MDQDELELPPDLPDDELPASSATAATTMAGTLALSHSQVETFAQCPRRWWLLKRAGVRRAPSESLILGLAVHAAIEADLCARLVTNEDSDAPQDATPPSRAVVATPASPSGPAVEVTRSSSLPSVPSVSSMANPAASGSPSPRRERGLGGEDPLADAFAALYDEEDPTGLIVPRRRELLLAQGRAVLRAYERIAPRMRPVEIEREFAFFHPDDPSITFTGRMDGVTQPDHGTQERTIVDWKVPRRRWLAGEEDRRIQAAAYLWAEARMGWERSARFTFITFPPAADPLAPSPTSNGEAGPRAVDARPTYRTPAALAAYAQLVRDTAARIREWESWGEEGFPARTSALCAWCEVRGACPTGQRYVRARGLTPQVPELPPDDADSSGG